MSNNLSSAGFFIFLFTFGFTLLSGQNFLHYTENQKSKKIIYFNPEIDPDVDEIKSATYDSFFSAVTDRFSSFRNIKMMRAEIPVGFDTTDAATLRETCLNNDAEYAVVSKIKFFKIGIGKYVLSSQVVVSIKVYDAEGNFITGTSYDTFRKNARILGSAENSIKIGTNGAMKNLIKNFRTLRK